MSNAIRRKQAMMITEGCVISKKTWNRNTGFCIRQTHNKQLLYEIEPIRPRLQ